MTFAVYQLGIGGYLPVQSLYLPDISWYFVTSISYNLITMIWFVYQNHCLTKAEIPGWLGFCGEKLKKIFCLCLPTDKNKQKFEDSGKKIITVEENPKGKCDLCDRCEKCESDYEKEEAKKKKKKDYESKLESLNYFIFIILLITLVITQILIWT